jgi:hypothetical protein
MVAVALILAGLFVVFLIAWAIDYAWDAAFYWRLARGRRSRRSR